MNKIFVIFFIILSLPQALAKEIYFRGSINPDSISTLERNIIEKINSLTEDQERVITIILGSGGGNIPIAINFVRKVRRISAEYNVQIDTQVNYERCESACTILFTAGHRRIARKKSYFGFHSPSIDKEDIPQGRNKDELLEWARTHWLDAIAAVDNQLPQRIKERELLYKMGMTYLRGKDLTTGYVNTID